MNPVDTTGPVTRRDLLKNFLATAVAAVLPRAWDTKKAHAAVPRGLPRYTFGNSVASYYFARRNAYLGTGYLYRRPQVYPYLPSYPAFFRNGAPGGIRFFFPYRGLSYPFSFFSNYRSSDGSINPRPKQNNCCCVIEESSPLNKIFDDLQASMAKQDYCTSIGARDQNLDNVLSFYMMPNPLVYLHLVNQMQRGDAVARAEFISPSFLNNAIATLDDLTENNHLDQFRKYKRDFDVLVRALPNASPYHIENIVYAWNEFSGKKLEDLALKLHPEFEPKDVQERDAYEHDYANYDLYVSALRVLNERYKDEPKALRLAQIGPLDLNKEEQALFDTLKERAEARGYLKYLNRPEFVMKNVVKLYMRVPGKQEYEIRNQVLSDFQPEDSAVAATTRNLFEEYHAYMNLRDLLNKIYAERARQAA